MVDIHFTYIVIFGVLYFLGSYTKFYPLITAAGIFIIGISYNFTLFSQTSFNYIFTLLLGIGSIYHSTFLIKSDRKNGRRT